MPRGATTRKPGAVEKQEAANKRLQRWRSCTRSEIARKSRRKKATANSADNIRQLPSCSESGFLKRFECIVRAHVAQRMDVAGRRPKRVLKEANGGELERANYCAREYWRNVKDRANSKVAINPQRCWFVHVFCPRPKHVCTDCDNE